MDTLFRVALCAALVVGGALEAGAQPPRPRDRSAGRGGAPLSDPLADSTWSGEVGEKGKAGEADELRDIFLVPIGPDASGMRYEAIFN